MSKKKQRKEAWKAIFSETGVRYAPFHIEEPMDAPTESAWLPAEGDYPLPRSYNGKLGLVLELLTGREIEDDAIARIKRRFVARFEEDYIFAPLGDTSLKDEPLTVSEATADFTLEKIKEMIQDVLREEGEQEAVNAVRATVMTAGEDAVTDLA